jgi:spermidine/putrescine ABC transporter ATP-binding subunit
MLKVMEIEPSVAAPIITIRGLSRYYGSVRALDNVSMDIAAGEFFSLLGPSGCGKTTLLRMLAGFDQPTAGEIFIEQKPITNVPPHRRPVKMVFQNYAIFPHLSVRENILYGLRKQKLSRDEADQILFDALELTKLPGMGARQPDQLSGGQRQRVALARALVCKPKVLLLDEPLGALDKKLREEMQVELRQLQRLVGITFVFVTHDQEEALAMSDRIAVMERGRPLQIDTPVGLYERPTSRAVAAFIGSMNLMEGRLIRSGADVSEIRIGETTVLRAAGAACTGLAGEPIAIGIRPEKIRLGWSPLKGPNVVTGRIRSHSYFGDRSHFVIEVHGVGEVVVALQNSVGRDSGSVSGNKVWLHLPEQAIHTFVQHQAQLVLD